MHGKSKLILKIFLLLIACLFLLLFKDVESGINKSVEGIYSSVAGEDRPDTNIVIIHISAEDIERVGPWPIKRSYYALLINSLTKLDVKKIGVEVFLSSRMVIQTIYDKLLQNEIEKSGRVVLSSLAGGIIKHNDNFYTDSLSYPSPKLLNESFSTGHLNYIIDDGVVIPFEVINQGITEEAFSAKLTSIKRPAKSILINFHSSWKQFRNYSLIEYFDLVNNNSAQLKSLKEKIVIIGISDPQFASTIKTSFDEQLPGIALHAFSLDNLLNTKWMITEYYLPIGNRIGFANFVVHIFSS